MELNALPTCDINHSNLNNKYLTIYHQNVRSLRRKANELLSHVYSDLPHIICITEHHMNLNEINLLKFDNYNIGAQFCREGNKKGGVVMYIHNSLKFMVIDLHKHSKDKDIEIIGVKLNVNTSIIHIITLYRSPTGNFNYFLQTLDVILQSLNSHISNTIICGDINVNYLTDNNQKKKLDNMLLSHNLTGIVNFPTRITGSSASAIDNIFFNITRFEDYSVYPLKNDLSDHDGQIVKIKTELPTFSGGINIVRKVNEYTIIDFLNSLSNESWESTFNTENVDLMFNSFLNTYLRIFYSSFPPIRINSRKNKKTWITQGIRKSCKHKRELFLLTKNSNNPTLNRHYKVYCNILTKVINEAKKNVLQ